MVEASTGLERTLWLCTVTAALACATIMVASNIRDVDEKPISISIDSIPVQVIKLLALISKLTVRVELRNF